MDASRELSVETRSDDRPYVVISADTHAGASVRGYRAYLDKEHQKLFDEWRGGYKNPQRKHIGSKKHKNWDREERVRDMEAEGVVGEIIFPNTVPPFFDASILICGNPSPERYPLWRQGVLAHNRWLVDWCAELPERRAGIGLVYLNDIDDAIEDVKWIASQGLRGGILLPHVPEPHLLPLYAPEYDRLWAVCQDLDVVINQHGGTGSPDYGRYAASLAIRLVETPFFSTRSFTHLVLGGVFERFPKLRYILTEAGCAWVPGTLKGLDERWGSVRAGSAGEFEFPADAATPEPPSFYALRNCWYGASFPSPREIRDRHAVGVDRILWGSDYPHYEGTFPHTRKSLRRTFHDVDPVEVRAMLGENAARFYDFDLEALRAIAEPVGPRPSEVARPLTPEEMPTDSASGAFR